MNFRILLTMSHDCIYYRYTSVFCPVHLSKSRFYSLCFNVFNIFIPNYFLFFSFKMLEADVNTTTLSPFDCSQIYIFPAVSIFS